MYCAIVGTLALPAEISCNCCSPSQQLKPPGKLPLSVQESDLFAYIQYALYIRFKLLLLKAIFSSNCTRRTDPPSCGNDSLLSVGGGFYYRRFRYLFPSIRICPLFNGRYSQQRHQNFPELILLYYGVIWPPDISGRKMFEDLSTGSTRKCTSWKHYRLFVPLVVSFSGPHPVQDP